MATHCRPLKGLVAQSWVPVTGFELDKLIWTQFGRRPKGQTQNKTNNKKGNKSHEQSN
jgi:hypothetical protein